MRLSRLNHPLVILLAGVLMLLISLMLPQHLATTDKAVLKYAGEETSSLNDVAVGLLDRGLAGPVELMRIWSDADGLQRRLEVFYKSFPEYKAAGGGTPYFSQYLELINANYSGYEGRVSVMKVIIARAHREKLFNMLEGSSIVSVKTILKTRGLANVSRFMPVYTAAGGPLEASILATALLLQGDNFKEEVQAELMSLVLRTLTGDDTAVDRLEQFYLSILGMGFRLNWTQFMLWAKNCDSVDTVIRSVSIVQKWPDNLPLFYSASLLVSDFGSVSAYLDRFNSEEGFKDLETAMVLGKGSLEHLLEMNNPIYKGRGWLSGLDNFRIMSPFCYYMPGLSLFFKIVCLFAATWSIFNSILSFSHLETPGSKEGMPGLRNVLLSLLFGILLLTLVEPGRNSAEGPKTDKASFHLNIANIVNDIKESSMNNITTDLTTIMVLLLFFVLQLIIYMIGIKKITQIREEDESADLKLQLLENEENLFDCGLYVGLGGTVASLILLAMDVVSASLVAAYASTLFGIIFVAILKIFHVRPYRRLLIVELKKS